MQYITYSIKFILYVLYSINDTQKKIKINLVNTILCYAYHLYYK